MKWGNYDLYWARPLKSIMAIFNNKSLNFTYHHLESSDFTYIDKDFEDKIKKFKNFKKYFDYFKKNKIIINQNIMKKFIEKELVKISNRKDLSIDINQKH